MALLRDGRLLPRRLRPAPRCPDASARQRHGEAGECGPGILDVSACRHRRAAVTVGRVSGDDRASELDDAATRAWLAERSWRPPPGVGRRRLARVHVLLPGRCATGSRRRTAPRRRSPVRGRPATASIPPGGRSPAGCSASPATGSSTCTAPRGGSRRRSPRSPAGRCGPIGDDLAGAGRPPPRGGRPPDAGTRRQGGGRAGLLLGPDPGRDLRASRAAPRDREEPHATRPAAAASPTGRRRRRCLITPFDRDQPGPDELARAARPRRPHAGRRRRSRPFAARAARRSLAADRRGRRGRAIPPATEASTGTAPTVRRRPDRDDAAGSSRWLLRPLQSS